MLINLKDFIQHFVDFRHEVVVRRTKFELAEAEKLMNQYKINALLVAENQQLTGVVQIYDIV